MRAGFIPLVWLTALFALPPNSSVAQTGGDSTDVREIGSGVRIRKISDTRNQAPAVRRKFRRPSPAVPGGVLPAVAELPVPPGPAGPES